jgi:hypothetical protein
MQNTFSLKLGVPGFAEPFGALEWEGLKRFRLAHMLYVDVGLGIGSRLFGSLSESFQFSLSQLHAFEEDFANDHGVFCRLTLQLPPLVRDLGYALVNLARVDSLYLRLFVQGGQTWASDECICLSDPKLEAGVEATIIASSFLSYSVGLTIGYAHPVLGADADASGVFFASFFSAF